VAERLSVRARPHRSIQSAFFPFLEYRIRSGPRSCCSGVADARTRSTETTAAVTSKQEGAKDSGRGRSAFATGTFFAALTGLYAGSARALSETGVASGVRPALELRGRRRSAPSARPAGVIGA
jgi:hypothetical protein